MVGWWDDGSGTFTPLVVRVCYRNINTCGATSPTSVACVCGCFLTSPYPAGPEHTLPGWELRWRQCFPPQQLAVTPSARPANDTQTHHRLSLPVTLRVDAAMRSLRRFPPDANAAGTGPEEMLWLNFWCEMSINNTSLFEHIFEAKCK